MEEQHMKHGGSPTDQHSEQGKGNDQDLEQGKGFSAVQGPVAEIEKGAAEALEEQHERSSESVETHDRPLGVHSSEAQPTEPCQTCLSTSNRDLKEEQGIPSSMRIEGLPSNMDGQGLPSSMEAQGFIMSEKGLGIIEGQVLSADKEQGSPEECSQFKHEEGPGSTKGEQIEQEEGPLSSKQEEGPQSSKQIEGFQFNQEEGPGPSQEGECAQLTHEEGPKSIQHEISQLKQEDRQSTREEAGSSSNKQEEGAPSDHQGKIKQSKNVTEEDKEKQGLEDAFALVKDDRAVEGTDAPLTEEQKTDINPPTRLVMQSTMESDGQHVMVSAIRETTCLTEPQTSALADEERAIETAVPGNLSSPSESPHFKTAEIDTANLSSPLGSPHVKRGEIDTTAPFESVKAAVSLFGERVDWKPHLRTPSMERRSVLESDLLKLQQELSHYKDQLSLTQASVAGITLELNRTKELLKAQKSSGTGQQDGLQGVGTVEQKEGMNEVEVILSELQKVLAEIESTKGELLSVTNLKQATIKERQEANNALDAVSKKIEELTEEQDTVNEALVAAQAALVEAEEQIELLKLDHSPELQEKVMSDILEGKSVELRELEAKIQEARNAVMKLKEEYSEVQEAEKQAVLAESEIQKNIASLKLELDHVRSTELESVTALSKVLEELDELKVKQTKAAENESSLSSEIQAAQTELERTQLELESMHSKEQTACATLASLQEELCKVREQLISAQSGEAAAREAKETLPTSIKQLAAEADEAKAAAEASRESVRRARLESEQFKAATSTALSRLQAALKESEAARASETMALAEIKALMESETKTAVLESEPEGHTGVTVSLEEYASLKGAVHEAEEAASRKVAEALVQVEVAKASQEEAQGKLDSANNEAETYRDEMQKAQKKADDAQAAKLAAEGELRKWRAEHEQRRRSGQGPLPPKPHATQNPQQKASNTEVAVKSSNKEKGVPPSFQEKAVVDLDSVSQVFSLKVPTPDVPTKVLPVKDVEKEKEKIKKKTFITRVASLIVRRKSRSQVLTK